VRECRLNSSKDFTFFHKLAEGRTAANEDFEIEIQRVRDARILFLSNRRSTLSTNPAIVGMFIEAAERNVLAIFRHNLFAFTVTFLWRDLDITIESDVSVSLILCFF